MRLRDNNKYYQYDPKSNSFSTHSGKPIEPSDRLKRAAENRMNFLKSEGYTFYMDFNQFDEYLSLLATPEKNELFHDLMEHYFEIGRWIREDKPRAKEFETGLKNLKRIENLIGILLRS